MMADCECIPTCLFFNNTADELDEVRDILKTRLCRGDNSQCARYTVYRVLGLENVPVDLVPNQMARARMILAKAILSSAAKA